MRRFTLALALLASPALAETDVRQALIDLANSSACLITEADAEAKFTAMGLTQDDVGPVAQDMMAKGEAEMQGDSFHLLPPLCTATDAAEATAPSTPAEVTLPPLSPVMAKIIDVFRANGCAMDEASGQPKLEAAGLTEDDLDSVGEESNALLEAGLMGFDEATGVVTVLEPLCSGTAETVDPADPLIRMLSENGCSLTQDAAAALVSNYGITMGEADEMADSLMDRGLATVEGDKLTLANCGQ